MPRQMRRKRREGRSQKSGLEPAITAGSQVFAGGRFRPLPDNDLVLVVDKAFSILENIGIAGAPDWLRSLLEAKGARIRHDGRVLFGRILVEAALSRAARTVSLPGFGRKGVFRSGAAMSTSVRLEPRCRCSMPKAAITASLPCPTCMT